MRASKYDAALLGPIVAAARTLADVLRALGLKPTGGNYRMIATRLRLAGLDTSHFRTRTIAARVAAVPRAQLEALVASSVSIAQILCDLDIRTDGRGHHEMKRRLLELGIDTSHLRGSGWARGETKQSHPARAQLAAHNTQPDEEVFVPNSTRYNNGPKLARRLVAMGWEYRCAWCGISEWRGQSLVLHLDHINGINNDNRLENLRLLCPNCHSQTDTYCTRARELAACYTLRHASVA